jgi:hypothetical protein
VCEEVGCGGFSYLLLPLVVVVAEGSEAAVDMVEIWVLYCICVVSFNLSIYHNCGCCFMRLASFGLLYYQDCSCWFIFISITDYSWVLIIILYCLL